MKLFVFSSKIDLNIIRAMKKEMWGTPVTDCDRYRTGLETKSFSFWPGSAGLLFCSMVDSFTVPFFSLTEPDASHVEREVWPGGEYTFTFKFRPLGDCSKWLTTNAMKRGLPSLKKSGKSLHEFFRFQPVLPFVPTEVTKEDWTFLVDRLGTIPSNPKNVLAEPTG